MIQQLVQLQPITAAAESNREAFIWRFLVHRCWTRAGRGLGEGGDNDTDFAPLRFFPVLFVLLRSQRTGRRRSRGSSHRRLSFPGGHPPGGFLLASSGLLSPLSFRPSLGGEFSLYWIRRKIHSTFPAPTFPHLGAGCSVSPAGESWVSSVQESSLTP